LSDSAANIPLTVAEVEDQRFTSRDPLFGKYLVLVASIIRSSASPDEDSQREISGALQALGNTIPSLPSDDSNVVTDDPLALRTEADTLTQEAKSEGDAVIAASLLRRAESLFRRADTASRTLLLLRRNQALRTEIMEQIDALYTSLTAFSIGGRLSAPELSGLAARIQSVAHEANAITAARAEVDTLITEPYRTRSSETEVVNLRLH